MLWGFGIEDLGFGVKAEAFEGLGFIYTVYPLYGSLNPKTQTQALVGLDALRWPRGSGFTMFNELLQNLRRTRSFR